MLNQVVGNNAVKAVFLTGKVIKDIGFFASG